VNPSDWGVDRSLSAVVVRQLVGDQFPALATSTLQRLGEGWDSETYLLDDVWVLRFPKRRDVVRSLECEIVVLRALAGRLPLPVPTVELFGRPGPAFPYPFVGYRKLPGRPASEMPSLPMSEADEQEAARALGAFLTELHRVPLAALPDDLPHEDPADDGREDVEAALVQLRAIDSELARRAADLLAAPRPARLSSDHGVLLHADLLPEHLLLSESTRRLTGIIDWGDAAIGPPAIDFAGPYAWRGRRFAEGVLSHYQGVVTSRDLDWMRPRVLAAGVISAAYGRLAHRPGDVASGLRIVELALTA